MTKSGHPVNQHVELELLVWYLDVCRRIVTGSGHSPPIPGKINVILMLISKLLFLSPSSKFCILNRFTRACELLMVSSGYIQCQNLGELGERQVVSVGGLMLLQVQV